MLSNPKANWTQLDQFAIISIGVYYISTKPFGVSNIYTNPSEVLLRNLQAAEMTEIHSFRLAIDDARLQRLRSKLALTDFPSELPSDAETAWLRGPPLASIKELADYWLNGFNWRKAEATLNDALPQFTTTINVTGFGNYDLHFVHLRSKVPNAIPLIFLHGWPGCFYEVSKMAHPLIDGNGKSEPAFHVIAPSLIDHGFSSRSRSVS